MKLSRYLGSLSKWFFPLILLATVSGCASGPATPTDTRDRESLAPGGPFVGEMQIQLPLSLPGEGK